MVTRWDPSTRAGAVAVKRKHRFDFVALQSEAENLSEWAAYEDTAGEFESHEPSPETGTYDWRSYLREEAALAKHREDRRRARDKRGGAPVPPPPPPDGLYA